MLNHLGMHWATPMLKLKKYCNFSEKKNKFRGPTLGPILRPCFGPSWHEFLILNLIEKGSKIEAQFVDKMGPNLGAPVLGRKKEKELNQRCLVWIPRVLQHISPSHRTTLSASKKTSSNPVIGHRKLYLRAYFRVV